MSSIRLQRFINRLVDLFLLNTTILKPNFHLLLGQVKCLCYADSSQSSQIHVHMEFPFQFNQLSAAECRPRPFFLLAVFGALIQHRRGNRSISAGFFLAIERICCCRWQRSSAKITCKVQAMKFKRKGTGVCGAGKTRESWVAVKQHAVVLLVGSFARSMPLTQKFMLA